MIQDTEIKKWIDALNESYKTRSPTWSEKGHVAELLQRLLDERTALMADIKDLIKEWREDGNDNIHMQYEQLGRAYLACAKELESLMFFNKVIIEKSENDEILTKDDYIWGAIDNGILGLNSGVPEEQLFHYLKASYRSVLSDGEIKLAANAALYKTKGK